MHTRATDTHPISDARAYTRKNWPQRTSQLTIMLSRINWIRPNQRLLYTLYTGCCGSTAASSTALAALGVELSASVASIRSATWISLRFLAWLVRVSVISAGSKSWRASSCSLLGLWTTRGRFAGIVHRTIQSTGLDDKAAEITCS